MKRCLLAAAAFLLIILVAAFWRFGWRTVPDYVPAERIEFSVPFRTMAEHNEVMEGRRWPYIVQLEAPGKSSALLYFGSYHVQNPDDAQIPQIEALWQEFAPTVAVTENRLGLFLGTRRMGVSQFGEFAVVGDLARDAGLPVYSLEPSWSVEVEEVKGTFSAAEATLFYTLRVFLSEREEGRSREEIDALALHLLRKRGSRPGLEGSLPDLEALDHLWQGRYAELGPWRDLPPEAVHPHPEPTRLQAIANLVNEVRDRHAARVILDLLSKGERVFAIAGGSHVVKQEPVLRAGYGP
jgi:hypothetical protein